MTTNDRAVRALTEMSWAVEPGESDITAAVALVLRIVRDDLAVASRSNEMYYASDAVDALNERVFDLTDEASVIGDTLRTEQPEPEPVVALVTVDHRGHLTADSTVSVGEWTWPVPETYGTVMWMHRVGRTLRDKGWSVTGEARPSAEPGVYEVPVKPIATGEG